MKVQRFLRSRLLPVLVAVIAVAIIATARIGSLRSERYFVKRIPTFGQVAWRNADRDNGSLTALVAITYTTQGRHESRLKNLFITVAEAIGLATVFPEQLQGSTDLSVIRFSSTPPANSGVAVNQVPSPATGSMSSHLVVHDGKLYLLDFGTFYEDLAFDEGDDGVPEDAEPTIKGWRFDADRFVEITQEEAQTVHASLSGPRHQDSRKREPVESNQSPQWQACNESVYSFKELHSCPLKVGEFTWTLNFSGAKSSLFDGPMSTQLSSSNGVDKILLSENSNVWTETTAADYSSRRIKFLERLPEYSRNRVVYGWGSYLFGLLVAMGVPFLLIRNALGQATNSKNYFPEVKPEDFPGIDSQKLEYFSQCLIANGFEYLRDFTVASPNPVPNRPTSFGRLFVNRNSKCFAEISQIFTPQKGVDGMRCCFLTDFEGDWRYATTDRVLDPLTYVARRPRSLWLSRPGMSCEEMLSLHMQMVAQMKMRQGLTLVDDTSVEGYFLRTTQSTEELKKTIRRKSFWLLPLIIQLQYHQNRGHYEWLGNTGLHVPATSWTPPVKEKGDSSWAATINQWAPILNYASSAMLVFSAYLMFFHSSHNAGAARFRIVLFVLGLAWYGVLALAKKKTAKAT